MANSLVKKENEQLTINKDFLKEYREKKAQADTLNKEIKEMENQIKEELKDLVFETTNLNDFVFVVGGGFWTFEFDLKRFKNENFYLYVRYLVPKQSKETYALRGKGGAK